MSRGVRPAPGALARLVRLPAALTVPGDVLVGAAAAGALDRRAGPRVLGSICLYWAGMALNDYADRELDARERPERPIPSGQVTPGQALGLAGGLTLAGAALTATTGRRAAGCAAAIAASVWVYDLFAKDTPAGPVAMATARGLDVLSGASDGAPGTRAATPAAGLVAAHTLGVTVLSRGEVSGAAPASAGLAVATSTLAAAGAAARALRRADAGAADRVLALGLAAVYLGAVAAPQVHALTSPDAATVRTATGAGVRGVIALQAALLAAHGAPRTAIAVAALLPVALRGSRRVSPT